jgi:hypothetical protein
VIGKFAWWGILLPILAAAVGCDRFERLPAKSAETIAVERKAGDFADYWSEVLRLSRRHVAHPDSFRVALDALPGSHLTDEEWDAWTAPYRDDPNRLAARLEEAMSTVTARGDRPPGPAGR